MIPLRVLRDFAQTRVAADRVPAKKFRQERFSILNLMTYL